MPKLVCRIVEDCVFRFRENRHEYLLLRRSSGTTPHPGIWQIVTGTMRRREKATEAALREFSEETGLTAERFWAVPLTGAFYDHRRDEVNLMPLFCVQVSPRAEVRLSGEHCAFAWLSYQNTLRRLVWPGQRNGVTAVEESIVSGAEAGKLLNIAL